MMNKPLSWSVLCFLLGCIGFSTSPAIAENELYVGVRLGRATHTDVPGTRGDVKANSMGYGLDVAYRLNRRFHLNANVSGNPHPIINGNVYTTGVSAEIHPLKDLSDLQATIGVGTAIYHFMGSQLTRRRIGLNFGGAVDVIFDGFHFGIASRYHAIDRAPIGGDFWTMMIRVGFGFKV